MVKPSKSMQPEHVDLQQASKRIGKGAAFGEDSFRNYMALKIATQRKQFGLVLPPPPPPQESSPTPSSMLKPPPMISKLKTPPQKRDALPDDLETNQEMTLSKNWTPTTRQPEVGLANRMATEEMNRSTVSIGIAPSLNPPKNPPNGAPTIYKRPTLLERRSLAPLPKMAYPMIGGIPSKARCTKSDGSGNDCPTPDRSVRFSDDVGTKHAVTRYDDKKSQPEPNTKMESIISRLKKRHGRGSRRVERRNAKKRKREERNDRIEGDEATNMKMDLPPASVEQEDGLAELDKLFAMTDETKLKNHSESDEDVDESEACREAETQTQISVTAPAASTITIEEECKSTSMIEDGLTELDRLFASAETAKDDDVPSSFHSNISGDDAQDNPGQQPSSLTERDSMVSTTGAANDDEAPFDLENDLSGEINQAVREQPKTIETMSAAAPQSPAVEDGDEESSMSTTPTSSDAAPSLKSIRRLRPDLFFYGVVVKVAGYTNPDNETIKRLLQKHGGDLETYETERVTHIIAQQLSTAKANVYKKARRPRPVCRPSWIVDSVREGKLLPHGNYLLVEERDQQQMGIQAMFQKSTEASKKQPPKTSITPSSPQKPAAIQTNPYAKKMKNSQHLEMQNGILSSMNETAQLSPVKLGNGGNRGILKSPKKTDKKFINGKIRTVGTDPDFLDSYFASSRLSFIGSFKQRSSSTHHPNDIRASPLFSNSKKLIFHVDMDCFFASVALRNFPQYQDKPVVISHHGNRSNDNRKNDELGNNYNDSTGRVPKNSHSECATCNYEARKYGIKKGMFLGRAKELCPDLIVLMYDFEGYEEVSQQVSEILYRVAASEAHPGVVETVSCDEAYVELNFNFSEESKELYDYAYEVAESIRNEIFDTTRCTASIGVGVNKFLAKLGTDKAKPNKSYCVRDYRELLQGLKLRDVHGVGWRTEKKLMEESLVTIQDVWDLGSRGETELIRILGAGTGKKIYNFTQGKDDRQITPVERKTIGAECNYGVRFDGPYGIDHFMEGLAKEVEKRMEGISMKGKKLTLKIKQRKKGASNRHKFLGHGSCHNLSKSTVIPGNTATRDSKIFKKIGLSLFREFAIADIHEVRGMGITISSLEDDNKNGKQTNASRMQSWLHQRNETESGDDIETVEQSFESKEFIAGETAVTKGASTSTPKSDKKLEGVTGVIDSEREVRNDQSPLMIELPPMSQIRMSQVEALPQELQKQVLSRLKQDSTGILEENKFDGSIDPGKVEEMSIEITDTSKPFDLEESLNVNNDLASTPQSIGKIGDGTKQDADIEVLKSIESPLVIELPPMSQIHMTQVEALPHELQQQIYSRMNQRADDVKGQEIIDITDEGLPTNRILTQQQVDEIEQQHSANRFRQTDLKRMMKLAAVRSGHEKTDISLTQLEQLPLEIKLQVVNGDDRQIGVLSQHFHRPASSFNDRSRRKSNSNRITELVDPASNPRTNVPDQAKHAQNPTKASGPSFTMNSTALQKKSSPEEPRRDFRIMDRVNVWKEDLLPLKEFLNDNCPLRYPNSIDMVLEFLSIVLKEGRSSAMVAMIRCIRNRNDEWSKMEIIEKIARSINDLHVEIYGAGLDIGWLMGVNE